MCGRVPKTGSADAACGINQIPTSEIAPIKTNWITHNAHAHPSIQTLFEKLMQYIAVQEYKQSMLEWKKKNQTRTFS